MFKTTYDKDGKHGFLMKRMFNICIIHTYIICVQHMLFLYVEYVFSIYGHFSLVSRLFLSCCAGDCDSQRALQLPVVWGGRHGPLVWPQGQNLVCQGRLQGGNSVMKTSGLNFDLLDLASIFRKLVQIDWLFLDCHMTMGL